MERVKEEKRKAEKEYLKELIEKSHAACKIAEREKQQKLYQQEKENERVGGVTGRR